MSSHSNEKLVLERSKELGFVFLTLPKGLTRLWDAAPAPLYPWMGMGQFLWARAVLISREGLYHPILLFLHLVLWRKGDCALWFSALPFPKELGWRADVQG